MGSRLCALQLVWYVFMPMWRGLPRWARSCRLTPMCGKADLGSTKNVGCRCKERGTCRLSLQTSYRHYTLLIRLAVIICTYITQVHTE